MTTPICHALVVVVQALDVSRAPRGNLSPFRAGNELTAEHPHPWGRWVWQDYSDRWYDEDILRLNALNAILRAERADNQGNMLPSR